MRGFGFLVFPSPFPLHDASISRPLSPTEKYGYLFTTWTNPWRILVPPFFLSTIAYMSMYLRVRVPVLQISIHPYSRPRYYEYESERYPLPTQACTGIRTNERRARDISHPKDCRRLISSWRDCISPVLCQAGPRARTAAISANTVYA